MSFAIVYTVKNESFMLPEAIKYYLAQGCTRIYVFYDGTTDDTPSLIEKFPNVVARPNIRLDELQDDTDWYRRMAADWEGWMDLRKLINVYWAALDAAKSGIKWLAQVDPDEILVNNLGSHFDLDDLSDMFSATPEDIDQIQMINLDVVPSTAHARHPFREHSLFCARFPVAEKVWRYSRFGVRKILRSPIAEAWYDQLFFMARLGRGFPRIMRHPVTNKIVPTGYFLSYFNGKSAIRTDRCTKMRPLIHHWEALPGQTIKTRKIGYTLHYDLISASHFMHKFRQRPDTTFVKALYTRWALGLIARDLPKEQVEEFFEKSVAISSPARQDELVRRGVLHRVGSVSDFYANHSS